MENEVVRTLDEGWDYRPDWRSRVVDRLLVEMAGEEDPLRALQDEQDPYVRQFFLFRRTAESMARESFMWAYRAHSNNRRTGAASLIKALVIAKVPVNDIAAKLRTSTKNIAVFVKLHFDVERYIEERDWLATIVFSTAGGSANDLAELRERRWLAAAFLKGRDGLERSLSPRAVMNSSEREEMSGEIRAILTSRAHEYVSSKQDFYAAPGAEDFEFLIRMMDASSRQPVSDDRDKTMQIFIQGINGVLLEKAKLPENANDEGLQMLRGVMEAQNASPKDAGKAA